MCKMLDAEFALVLYDSKDNSIMAARDPIGIRPMFYGYTKKDHKISFASEAKALIDYCDDIMPFPPGHYYKDGKFTCYNDLSNTKFINNDNLNTSCRCSNWIFIKWRLRFFISLLYCSTND